MENRFVVCKNTGSIKRTITCDIDNLGIQVRPGEILIEYSGGIGDDTHYWTGTDFALYPPRPGDWDVWTGSEWVDPRTPEDIAAEAAARLYAARAAASMTRLQFALTAAIAGILPPEDAPAAARGDIPPSMLPTFSALPEADRLVYETVWAGATVIDRLNPVLLMLANTMNITDTQLDAMFEVQP